MKERLKIKRKRWTLKSRNVYSSVRMVWYSTFSAQDLEILWQLRQDTKGSGLTLSKCKQVFKEISKKEIPQLKKNVGKVVFQISVAAFQLKCFMPVLTLNQQISEVDSNLEKTSVWLISPSRSSPCVTLECWQCSVYLNHSLDGWWMTTFTWRFAMDFMKIRSLRSCSGLSLIKRAGSLSTTQRPKSFFQWKSVQELSQSPGLGDAAGLKTWASIQGPSLRFH